MRSTSRARIGFLQQVSVMVEASDRFGREIGRFGDAEAAARAVISSAAGRSACFTHQGAHGGPIQDSGREQANNSGTNTWVILPRETPDPRALPLPYPPSILLRADEVIE
jgi:hypothetical protein